MKREGLIFVSLAVLTALFLLFSVDPAEAKSKAKKAKAPAAAAEAEIIGEETPAGREVLHMVKPGEELHMLAGYYYSDCRQWPRIYRHNRAQIKNPNLIHPGEILSIAVPEDWQPYMNYEEFFQKASAGAAPQKAPEAAPKEAAEEKKS